MTWHERRIDSGKVLYPYMYIIYHFNLPSFEIYFHHRHLGCQELYAVTIRLPLDLQNLLRLFSFLLVLLAFPWLASWLESSGWSRPGWSPWLIPSSLGFVHNLPIAIVRFALVYAFTRSSCASTTAGDDSLPAAPTLQSRWLSDKKENLYHKIKKNI